MTDFNETELDWEELREVLVRTLKACLFSLYEIKRTSRDNSSIELADKAIQSIKDTFSEFDIIDVKNWPDAK